MYQMRFRFSYRVVLTLFLTATCLCLSTAMVFSTEPSDFKTLVGKWVRTDGGYVIHIRDIKSDGSVDLGYFNPREINISEAGVTKWKGLNKLFIKLQDEGYPGSTYTLYYYAEKDALAGFYYQATMEQTFEVVFFREKVE